MSGGDRTFTLRCKYFLFLVVAVLAVSRTGLAQSATTSWAGQITCQLDDQDATYSRHETQTWKLLGGPPDPQPGIPHYPAVWSATGQGTLTRTQGAETVNIQWATNVPSANAMIAIFVRASDQRLVIKTWHGQLTVPNAVTGTKQVTQNGVTQAGTGFTRAAWEWSFPHIEVDPSSTVVTGSTTSQADAGSAELVHHYGGVPPSTTCQWQLASGGAAVPAATPPAGSTPGSPVLPSTLVTLPTTPLHLSLPPGSGTAPPSGTTLPPGTVVKLPSTPLKAGVTPVNPGTVVPVGSTGPKPLPGLVKSTSGTPTMLAAVSQVNPSVAQGQQTVSVTITGRNTSFQNGATTVTFVSSQGTLAQQQATNAAPSQAANAYQTLLNSTIGPSGGGGGGSAAAGPSAGSAAGGNPPGSTGPAATAGSGPAPTAQLAVTSLNIVSPTSALVQLAIDPAALGAYTVTATTALSGGKGTETASLTNGFTVTAPPSPASGNYLVTISGILCLNPTSDDPLDRDGKGDEIYGAAFVRQYDRRNGQGIMSTEVQTWVYGDINGFAGQRQQAGSLSATGGIQVGDFIPDNLTATVPFNSHAASPNMFPMVAWQGTLTDGADALIISPSVWEWDGDETLLYSWVQSQTTLMNNGLFFSQKVQNQVNGTTVTPLVFGNNEAFSRNLPQAAANLAAAGVIDATLGLPPLQLLFGHSQDRPIGFANQSMNAVDANTMVLPSTAVILTREIIEANARSTNVPGGPPGAKWMVFQMDFQDTTMPPGFNGNRRAHYTMFIQVQTL